MRLALTGKMRSGKDAAAKHLIEAHGFHRVAFGDGIRQVISDLFPKLDRSGNKPREVMQKVGQTMREIDPNVWTRLALDKIVELPPDQPVVVTDLRQPNEYELLRAVGFQIVRIHADLDVRILRMIEAGDEFTLDDLFHETEMHVDTFEVDAQITNHGSLDELYTNLNQLIGGAS